MNTKPFALIVAALLLTAATSTARAITYKTLDYPGSNRTDAFGISGNNIVGLYASSFYHGYLYDGTTYTPIDYPGAANYSIANGIDGNNIVGDYSDSSLKDHGFLYNGSSYTPLDDPLGVMRNHAGIVEATSAFAISGNNIVGLYYDSSDVAHGFLYNGAMWTTLDFPGSTYTEADGISGTRIVGSYTDAAGNKHGFLYNSGAYATLDAPLGTKGTNALGIDGNNIVGSYIDTAGLSHGFLYDGSSYRTLDDPLAGPVGTVGLYSGSNGTGATAISGNNIVGYYIDASGIEHGFLATVSEPGDYNGNGVVDAADYVVWRKGLGTTYTQADYDVWRTHFGQTAGSGVGAGANAAVPEPASLMLAALGFFGVVVFGVRRQRQYSGKFLPNYRNCSAVAFLLVLMGGAVISSSVSASTVYSNDFENVTTGFTNAGALPALTRTSLPTDGGGLSSPNQSMWLGRLGEGVTKSTSSKEIVDLNVSGLTPGTVYTVAFDLLVGASWDGAADGYGTDAWYFSVDGTRLVDTMFSNGDQGVDYGAYSPQRYSDAHYADPIGPDVNAFTGAEFSRRDGPGYTGYYGIYYFSHGAGNPNLKFTATGSSIVLEWARYSGGTNFSDSPDEYWALDNVAVSSVPEPSTFVLAGLGFLSLVVRVRRTSTRNYV